MPLSKLQRTVARSALRSARKLIKAEAAASNSGVQNQILFVQTTPHASEFQNYRYDASELDALEHVYPPALKPLIALYPTRSVDGATLRQMVRSMCRQLPTTADSSSSGSRGGSGNSSSIDDDTALVALRLLSDHMKMSESTSVATTDGMRVVVTAIYDEHASQEAGHGQQVFFYRCTVHNVGQDLYQLMGRHWVFVDKNQRVCSEVPKFGSGVIGQYPLLRPGQSFQYMSQTIMPEAGGGVMKGSFLFTNKTKGIAVEVKVAPCPLVVPSRSSRG